MYGRQMGIPHQVNDANYCPFKSRAYRDQVSCGPSTCSGHESLGRVRNTQLLSSVEACRECSDHEQNQSRWLRNGINADATSGRLAEVGPPLIVLRRANGAADWVVG